MRFTLIAIATALLIATSAAAVQLPHRGECRQLTRQIETHSKSFAMARQRGNALWARATQEQIDRLDQRRLKLCPDLYSPSERSLALAEMKRLAKMAAQAALSFFTMGAM